MDPLTMADLRTMMAHRVDQCVSLYMPTHPAGPDAAQDLLRLRNLADAAAEKLIEHGMRPADARDAMRAVRDIPKDEPFWLHRSNGLAVFFASDWLARYRLPISFEPELLVNRRFHIKPLMGLFSHAGFLVLELNQSRPHLFRGSRFQLEPVPVPDMPGPIDDTLNQIVVDGGSQTHTAMRGVAGKQGSVFHGQGGLRDTAKEDLVQYLREVDRALQPVLRSETLPLVLVGVDYILPLFRSVCHYPRIVSESVRGNAEHWSIGDLHARVLPLVEHEFAAQRVAAVARFRQLHGTGKASDNLMEVVPAAVTGKVETLLIEASGCQWGAYDAKANRVELRDAPWPGDEDLVDLSTVETLTNRGHVIVARRDEMPTDSHVAAIFRY